MGKFWGFAVSFLVLASVQAAPAVAAPEFPDIDSLPAVDVDAYMNPDHSHWGGQSPNPLGWFHAFVVGDVVCIDYPWHFYGYLTCRGALPGAPIGTKRVVAHYAKAWDTPSKFYTEMEMAADHLGALPRDQINELPLGAKIVFDQDFFGLSAPLTCGVPESKVLACRAVKGGGAHGFVLSREGSWTF